MAINRKVAGLLLLAALDYKEGNRSSASRRLQTATEDPDFEETVDGLSDITDEQTDPFLNPQEAGDDEGNGEGDQSGSEDEDLNLQGLDDLLNDKGEQASLARAAKRKPVKAADDDKIGGNDGPTGADPENNSDEEIRQEAVTARLRQTRQNLMALANVR